VVGVETEGDLTLERRMPTPLPETVVELVAYGWAAVGFLFLGVLMLVASFLTQRRWPPVSKSLLTVGSAVAAIVAVVAMVLSAVLVTTVKGGG
jgi:hypothetical protein